MIFIQNFNGAESGLQPPDLKKARLELGLKKE